METLGRPVNRGEVGRRIVGTCLGPPRPLTGVKFKTPNRTQELPTGMDVSNRRLSRQASPTGEWLAVQRSRR